MTVPSRPSSRAASSPESTTFPLRSFAVGERLAGRYRVDRPLGRGAMGDVWEVWDEELEIPVALKTLNESLRSDPDAVKRMKREVLLARAVAHPNVCRVYDLGRHEEDGSTWFLTMELLHGTTLRERLSAGALPPEQALRVARQIAAGLGAAHQAGVLHRDFKSSNVMLVGRDGERAVITDFGLAIGSSRNRGAGSTTVSGAIVGTPAYMAPEQVQGGVVGTAADIYALGVVFFEMITGSLPFEGASGFEMMIQRLFNDPPPPSSRVPGLDPIWDDVILQCMEREPDHRFATPEQAGEALVGAAEPRPIQVTGRGATSLARERDPFFGRGSELNDLRRRFEVGARWVTIVGGPGLGKTRLATHFGWTALPDYPGGVWFSNASEARDLEGLVSAVASGLAVRLGRGDILAQVGRSIAGHGQCLIVIDCADSVIESAAEAIEAWFDMAGGVKFLVTSRERLKRADEQVVLLESLDAPAAVELFIERAGRQSPGYRPDEEERGAIRELVQSAELVPLAIELAAARIRAMSPRQMQARIRERLNLFGGGSSGRHGTLRSAIDASWELLKPWEQSALAQCSVFDGAFTLEAAEGVLDLSSWPRQPWPADVVQGLMDKSLLRLEVDRAGPHSGTPRFSMFDSVRDYAREKLGSGSDVEVRHGRWFANYGSTDYIEGLFRHGGLERRWAIVHDLDDVVTACRRAVARGDADVAVPALRAAWAVLEMVGPFDRATRLAGAVLELPLGDEPRANALLVLGQAAGRAGRSDEAMPALEEAVAIFRRTGSRAGESAAWSTLGNVNFEHGRSDAAQECYEAALAAARADGSRQREGIALSNLAGARGTRGELEQACRSLEEALEIHREVGNSLTESMTLGNLANFLSDLGRYDEARARYEAAIELHQRFGDRRSEGIVAGNLGNLHTRQRRWDEARAQYAAALAIHRELGNLMAEGDVLSNLTSMLIARGAYDEALEHGEAGLVIHRELNNVRSLGSTYGHLAAIRAARGEWNEARRLVMLGEERLRQVGDPLELGKLLCIRGEVDSEWGDHEAAGRAYDEAAALASRVGAGGDTELSRMLERLRHRLSAS